jgi:hypothetical protein
MNASATASPIPLAAPVTTAVRPSSCSMERDGNGKVLEATF